MYKLSGLINLKNKIFTIKNASTFSKLLPSELNEIKAAGTWKNERIITSAQKTKISLSNFDKKVLNFCANNYLGLAVSIKII